MNGLTEHPSQKLPEKNMEHPLEFDKWNGYGKRPADGSPRIILDLMEWENGVFRIDGSMEFFEEALPEGLEILVNGQLRAYESRAGVMQKGNVPGCDADPGTEQKRENDADPGTEQKRENDADPGRKQKPEPGADTCVVVKRAAFALAVPAGELQKKNTICFRLKQDAKQLSLVTSGYQAKLTSSLQYSWWTFGDYVVTFHWKGREAAAISIEKMGRIPRILHEGKLLKEIVTASYGSKQMFVMRCMYWLAMPVYSRKNIWLTFDKLYKGGDCGEYFYKYLSDHRPAGVEPVYVLRKDAKDYKRLVQEGYHPLAYRTGKQRISYLYASMVFATHSGVPSFGGFNKWEIRYVQDRLRAVNTCIQHGLSVQDLTYDSNRIVNNNKRYYCASKYEIENLSRPSYDYQKDVLRLTGIPRYDGLENRDKKQILIAPTWRSYAAMPSVMGSGRPYNPDFVNTDYYRIYRGLLENKKLRETAARCGYRILYLLHPVLNAQLEDFISSVGGNDGVRKSSFPGENDGAENAFSDKKICQVEVASSLDISYEQALTESSLMVTDYSGVQFDFAYMRKPVVYFHTPKLPPHYEEGGFFYDTQGFGEICTDTDELVRTICEYMEDGCGLKDFYRSRQDDFFAFDDRENCRRICEDALNYQSEKRQKKETKERSKRKR